MVNRSSQAIPICLSQLMSSDGIALLPQASEGDQRHRFLAGICVIIVQHIFSSAVKQRLLVDISLRALAGIRMRFFRLRLILHRIIFEGEFHFRELERFSDDHVAHSLELLLLRKRHTLRRSLIIVDAELLSEILPELVGFSHALIFCQLVHDLIHDPLDAGRQVTVNLSAADSMQSSRQFRCQQLQLAVLQRAGCHLSNERHHLCLRLLLEKASLFIFLLVDVQTVVSIDRADQSGLNAADALLGEVSLFWIRREDDHVDMEVLLFFMERGIPAQVIRVDLIALGDVCDGGVDERLPVLQVGVTKPFRILAGEGDDRRPHVSCVLCHLRYGILQRSNFPIGIPQAMFAQRFYAGAVCHIVEIVFPAVHRLNEIFVDLFDEVKGSLPIRCVHVVIVFRQFSRFRKTAEQTQDILLLFFRSREVGIVVPKELHAFTGSEVAGSVRQARGISAALHVGRDKY